jgi:hypothetical protein
MDNVQNPSNSEYILILKLRLLILKINVFVIKFTNISFSSVLKNILGSGKVIIKIVMRKKQLSELSRIPN